MTNADKLRRMDIRELGELLDDIATEGFTFLGEGICDACKRVRGKCPSEDLEECEVPVSSDSYGFEWLTTQADDIPRTNADRIRAMTDEEMLEEIYRLQGNAAACPDCFQRNGKERLKYYLSQR